ncbi:MULTISPECIES: peptidylprolyl isomerase [unclassified Corallococcus]|uniref:peptidylprolyl isomerase n=1 Tax=unclassified Corallococcus TaxID=2685029 RepID=UPI001A8F33FE|nr:MULTISPECIES: peptidyl-prolyl cis-trans isomerase [unclassified Corallococcus]MBN9680960.1 peptidyl-prolyl cis-trans isomerase [Corallococcus sp. NCSPR001]WAS87443.1 peptidyl-prolyl cis-trans isomerase [Corallococcus sp. NCRR]
MRPASFRASLLSRSVVLSLGLALGVLGLTGCRPQAQEGPDPTVVATVNGESLSRTDFEQELARELATTEGPEPTPEEVEPFKRALVDTLVKRMLLLQAAKQNNIAVTPEEVDRGVLRLSGDYPAGNFNEVLAQGQLSMAELRAREASRLTIEKLFTHHVYSRVAVTEEELRAYYAAHEADFQEPEEVHAAQMVVKGLDEARRLQAQLKAGKKFSDLARRYSLSADAKVGGDLGFFPRGQMPPAFDEVVFKLGVGQVSDVVSTEYGYHLFKVLERRSARKRELVEVRAKVEGRLLEAKRAAAQEAFEKELRDKAQVVVNEATLQTIRGRPAPQAAK